MGLLFSKECSLCSNLKGKKKVVSLKDFCLLNIHSICLVSIQTESAISENMWEKTKSETTTTSENRSSTPNKCAPALHMVQEHFKLHKYCIKQKTEILKSKRYKQDMDFHKYKFKWPSDRITDRVTVDIEN